jgi:hypothetical protein
MPTDLLVELLLGGTRGVILGQRQDFVDVRLVKVGRAVLVVVDCPGPPNLAAMASSRGGAAVVGVAYEALAVVGPHRAAPVSLLAASALCPIWAWEATCSLHVPWLASVSCAFGSWLDHGAVLSCSSLGPQVGSRLPLLVVKSPGLRVDALS